MSDFEASSPAKEFLEIDADIQRKEFCEMSPVVDLDFSSSNDEEREMEHIKPTELRTEYLTRTRTASSSVLDGLCNDEEMEQKEVPTTSNSRHIDSRHRRHQCRYCSKNFATATRLHVHTKFHTVLKANPCPKCGIRIAGKCNLTDHLKSHHEPLYVCQYCVQKLPSSLHLAQHVGIHTEERLRHLCLICGKSFERWKQAVAHSKVHSTNKPFVCTYCCRAFRLEQTLDHHNRFHHTATKPWECEHCNKAFYSETTLRSHTMVHTGEKPYACELCSRTFRMESYLERHRTKDHKLEYPDSG